MQNDELLSAASGLADFLSRRLVFMGAVGPNAIRDFGEIPESAKFSVEPHPDFVDMLRIPSDYFDRNWD